MIEFLIIILVTNLVLFCMLSLIAKINDNYDSLPIILKLFVILCNFCLIIVGASSLFASIYMAIIVIGG